VTGIWPPLRTDLQGLEPYGAPQIDVPVRLNTNENPFPPSPALVDAIGNAVAHTAASLNRYPDRDAMALRGALAGYVEAESGVSFEPVEIWPANGSNEVMAHIFAAYGGTGRTALSFTPTYSMYAQYARDSHTAYVTRPRATDFTIDGVAMRSAITEVQPDLVVVTSPNNPTGTAMPLDVIETACESAPGIVVVDEAYAEFRRPGVPSATSLIDSHRNLIVTRTMSKAFALAGARLGYALGSVDVLAGLQIVRLPYHLSSVTQIVARTALEHSDDLLAQVGALRTERDHLIHWLRDHEFRAPESDANFILFGRFADAHRVWRDLLERGVLVRESGPEGWLRVSVGTPQDNVAFRDALMDVVAASGMIMADGERRNPKE